MKMIAKNDANWLGTKEWIEGRIATLQLQLERTDLGEAEHNRTRGMIAAYRELIREVEPEVVKAAPARNYNR